MSTTVDERVVEMRFDNKNFESNVKTSMSTLERLKKALKLDGAAKGLENIGAAAKKCDISPLGSAVQSVQMKFSALEVMGVTALATITNSAIRAGERIASAITIDPVKSGFSEYETQINAIQTILANTESKGTTLDQVNSALDELNKYADQTIYNFTEMTRNIGTFTAAGVDLDKSVTSIKGIANLAAVSGSNAYQASTAMYQLSQALAAGRVSLMDWNSVVNAGMGGEVFQTALKRTATNMGYDVEGLIEQYGSFRESLTEGQWLTAEVLTETLTQLSGAYSEADLIAQGYTESQAQEITKLAQTAVDAATKVKTFTQLFDTLGEALQSGWTQTWEILIGDFEEAKDLLTSISNTLGGFINSSAEARNNLLEGAMTSNWDKLIKKVNEAGIETDKFEETVVGIAKENNVPLDNLIKKYGSLEAVVRAGRLNTDILREAVNKLNTSLTDFSSITRNLKMGDTGEDVTKIQEALKGLGYDLGEAGVDSIFGSATQEAIKAFQEAQGIEITGIIDEETLKALEEASGSTEKLVEGVDELIDGINELGGRELLIESFKNVFDGLLSVLKPIQKAFRNVFPPTTAEQIKGAIEQFHSFTEGLQLSGEGAEKLQRTFEGLFSILSISKKFFGGAFSLGFKAVSSVLKGMDLDILDVTASIGDAIKGFDEWLEKNDFLSKGLEKFGAGLKSGYEQLSKWIEEFKQLPMVQQFMEDFNNAIEHFPDLFGDIGKHFENFVTQFQNMGELDAEGIKNLAAAFKDGIVSFVTEAGDKLNNFVETYLSVFTDGTDDALTTVGDHFTNLKNKVIETLSSVGEWIKGLNWGAILSAGLGAGVLVGGVKITKGIMTLAKPLLSIGEILEGVADKLPKIMTAISKSIKASAMEKNSKALKNVATSITMLAASVYLISTVDSDKLWGSVGAIGVLAGGLIGLSVAMGKIGKLGDFKDLGKSLRNIAAALLILVVSLKAMEGLNRDTLGENALVLGILAGALILFTGVLSKNVPQMTKGSGMLIAVALAVKILVSALGDISKIDTGSIVSSVLVLGVLMKALESLSKSTSKMKFTQGVGMLAMVAALKMLVSAVDDIASLDSDKIADNLLNFVVVFAALGALTKSTQKVGTNAIRAGAGILMMSAALLVVAQAIKMLGSMDEGDMALGLSAVSALMLVFSAVTALTKNAGQNGVQTGAMLLMMSGAIAILAGVMSLIGDMEIGNIAKGLTAITILAGVFAGLMAVTKIAKNCTKTMVVVTAVVAALAAVLGILATLAPENLISTSASLSALLLSLSATMLVFSKIPITGTLSGVGSLAIAVAGLTAIIAAIGGIAQIPGFDWIISEGTTALGAIGNAIGTFIGSIGGGILSGVTSGLDEVGTNLSAFMTNAQSFFDGISGITSESLSGVATLSDIVLKLTAGNFLDAITSFLTGGQDLAAFGTKISQLGTGLKGYGDAVEGLDTASIESSVTAVESLVELESSLPKIGGLMQAISGIQDIGSFGTRLSAFGAGLKEYNSCVTGESFDPEAISASAEAAKSLAEVAQNVPEVGNIQKVLDLPTDLELFGNNLENLGSALKKYNSKVTGETFDSTKITESASALSSLVDVANNVPSQSSLQKVLDLPTDLSLFSTNLESLAGALSSYSNALTSDENGIDTTAISNSIQPLKDLTEVAKAVPANGTFEKILGLTDLDVFTDNLGSLGGAVKAYSDATKDIKADEITGSLDITQALADFVSIFDGEWNGTQQMIDFGSSLSQLGAYLQNFSTQLESVNTEKLGSASTALKQLSQMAKNVTSTEITDTSFSSFGSALSDFASTSMSDFAKAVSDSSDEVSVAFADAIDQAVSNISDKGVNFNTAGSGLAEQLLQGMKAQDGTIPTAFNSVVLQAAANIESFYSRFHAAGGFLGSGLANGIRAMEGAVVAAAVAVANAGLNAVNTRLHINSPSKETYKSGTYFGMGLVNGIKEYSSKTFQAGSLIGENAKTGLSKAMSKVRDVLDGDMNIEPRITPVVDLDEVRAGAGQINSMFRGGLSVGATANLRAISSSMSRRNQNGVNGEVVSAIDKLRKELKKTGGNTYNVNGITYDDGSNIANAIATLIRATEIEGRV